MFCLLYTVFIFELSVGSFTLKEAINQLITIPPNSLLILQRKICFIDNPPFFTAVKLVCSQTFLFPQKIADCVNENESRGKFILVPKGHDPSGQQDRSLVLTTSRDRGL